MFFKKSLLIVFTVFVFCESGFDLTQPLTYIAKYLVENKHSLQVINIKNYLILITVDNLKKCKINDGDCEKDLIQSIIRDGAKNGIPELNIPQLDPVHLKNVSVSVLDVLDITLLEGSFKGVKNCIVEKFSTDIEKSHASIELTCDISVKGRYKVFASSPIVKNLFGGESIQGDGNGKIKIEKLFLRIDFFFIVKKENGEIYLQCFPDKNVYAYDIKGKMTFFADNLYIGKQESSKLVTDLLNQNWKFIMSSFGKSFMDKAMAFIYEFLHKFFNTVPTKHYIIDDLTPYVTKEY